jgi:hypothetical protein
VQLDIDLADSFASLGGPVEKKPVPMPKRVLTTPITGRSRELRLGPPRWPDDLVRRTRAPATRESREIFSFRLKNPA